MKSNRGKLICVVIFLLLLVLIVLAANPEVTLNSPANESGTTNNFMELNVTIEDDDNDNTDVKIYGNESNSFNNKTLLYYRLDLANGTEIIYNWTAPVLEIGSNTVLLMHFNNLTGFDNQTNVYDETGQYNGTKKGNNEPLWNSSGKFAYGLKFDGIDDYISIADDSFQDLSEGTIEAWINVEEGINETIFCVKENEGDSRDLFIFYVYNGRLVSGLKRGASWAWLGTGDSTIYNNSWTHVVVTVNGTGNRMYVNGVEQTVSYTSGNSRGSTFIDDLPPPPLTAVEKNYIGKCVWDNLDYYVFNGSIDEFAIYNKSLSSDEILDHYRLKEGHWYWKADSDDTGAITTSNIRRFTIGADWSRDITDFGSISVNTTHVVRLGNLTIRNDGLRKLQITFNVTSNRVNTTYNFTMPFNLTSGNNRTVAFNITAPGSSGIYPVILTVNGTLSSSMSAAVPNTLTTNASLVVTSGEPSLFVTIDKYPSSVVQGNTGQNLSASIINRGSALATDTYVHWILPDGWSNTTGPLNYSIGNLSIGGSSSSNITVSITNDATTGTQTIVANATGQNETLSNIDVSLIHADSKSVDVIEKVIAVAPGGAVSAGAVGGGSSGGGSVKTVEEQVEVTEEFRVARGLSQDIPFIITNPYTNSILKDVTLEIDGFLSQYITIRPNLLTNIGFNKSKEFIMTVNVPAYLEKTDYLLNATIKGRIVPFFGNIEGLTWKALTDNRLIKMIVGEVSIQSTNESITQAGLDIGLMIEKEFGVEKASELLEQAKLEFENEDYEESYRLSQQVSKIKNNAFVGNELIEELQDRINYANKKKGLKTEETESALRLALLAFDREDYEAAIERVKDAQLTFVLETKGKINILYFIWNWWWLILLISIGGSVAGWFIYKKSMIKLIEYKLKNLVTEEKNIIELMKEAQKKAFTEKTLSTTEYHKLMYEYEKRLNKIRQTREKLRSKRVGILQTEEEIKSLEKENKAVIELIKQAQRDYLQKGIISKSGYEGKVEEDYRRLAEIEDEKFVLEDKLDREKISKKYKILRKINNIFIFIERLFRKKRYSEEEIKEKVKALLDNKEEKLGVREIEEIDEDIEKSSKEETVEEEIKEESEPTWMRLKRLRKEQRERGKLTKKQIDEIDKDVQKSFKKKPSVEQLKEMFPNALKGFEEKKEIKESRVAKKLKEMQAEKNVDKIKEIKKKKKQAVDERLKEMGVDVKE